MRPYKITIVKNNYYEFTTVAGIKYACYFLPYAEYFKSLKEIALDIYAFNIEMLEDKNIDFAADSRIGYTIVQIIKKFLKSLVTAVVYVCDNRDSRELLRRRKFNIWFSQYDDGTIIKIDGHISFKDFNIYNAILIHKDNPPKNRFIEAFNDLNNSAQK